MAGEKKDEKKDQSVEAKPVAPEAKETAKPEVAAAPAKETPPSAQPSAPQPAAPAPEKPKEGKKPAEVKKEKPANCAACNKSIKKKRWYYRNGKHYCTKRCWQTTLKKEEKPKEGETPPAK
jgi:hypothetical protein